MVTVIFPDRETEKRALAFLLGRFSGRVLRSGEHLVPEAALEALADQNIRLYSIENQSLTKSVQMTTATVTIPLDTETAQIYLDASAENQKKLRLLLSLWLREFAISPTPLKVVMDKISEEAQARGLTPEILESLLNAN